MTKQRKVFQRFTTVCLTLIGLFAVVTSCHGEEEKYEVAHKIMFKAEASAGSNITHITHNGKGEVNQIDVSGTTWTSPEITETNRLRVGETVNWTKTVIADAIGANASSTLKVQIYVDGVLKKEVITTGKGLTSRADYDVEFKVN